MKKKLLGMLLISTPIILLLIMSIVTLGLVKGMLTFLLSILVTAIVSLCVAKGIDLLDE